MPVKTRRPPTANTGRPTATSAHDASHRSAHKSIARALAAESGFTMIVALGVLFVSGLLVVAAFTAAKGDIGLSHQDSTNKQAYYAALAGIQQYEYHLQANPDYWENCESLSGTLEEEPSEHYEATPLLSEAATSTYGITECMPAKPFESLIEPTGAAANTFRVQSIGRAGGSTRKLVATFQVTGFLNYVYFTQYETMDPGLYEEGAPSGCAEKYWGERSEKCVTIQFTSGDAVNGPLHTDDAADVCGTATFGRPGHDPPDVVQMNRGTYSLGYCSGSPTYYTATKSYTKGNELIPPQSDTSLARYVEPANEFTGVTHIVLKGEQIQVTTASGETKTIAWPSNGLIYVRSSTCNYTFKQDNSDNAAEEEKESGCGNVYVSGYYSKSLTIGSEGDVIVNGNIYPTSVAGKLGAVPTGTATLGLIANDYVRIYHPVEQECTLYYNKWQKKWVEKCENIKNAPGSLKNPWIYAAILSTRHSFAVDNYSKGEELGELNVYGAIAQKYRGTVGTGGGYTYTGYIKDYIYDERLAVDEPPFFLSPLNAGWKVARETSDNSG